MPFENSPSLQEFAQGMPSQPPQPSRGPRRARMLITALGIITAVLVLVNVVSSRPIASSGGGGIITGMVLDARGRPAVAEIIIERTDLATYSDASGRFAVEQVPAGAHLLVVASDTVAVEYPIVAVAGAQVDIGTVQVQTTVVPLP